MKIQTALSAVSFLACLFVGTATTSFAQPCDPGCHEPVIIIVDLRASTHASVASLNSAAQFTISALPVLAPAHGPSVPPDPWEVSRHSAVNKAANPHQT